MASLPKLLPRRSNFSSIRLAAQHQKQINITSRRAMASTSNPAADAAPAKRKYEWLVVVPDLPGVLEKRLEVRPKHFAGLQPFVESGAYKMGGAILEEVPKDDEASSMKFIGSTLITTAESREEVIEILKKDIYTTSGVWDIEKVQIWPLKCAFRHP